jgi:hypothetical protein
MSEAVKNYLTTKSALKRIAIALSLDPTHESHILAGEIEERIIGIMARNRHVYAFARQALELRCSLCNDVDGVLLVREGRLICEDCESILEQRHIESAESALEDALRRANELLGKVPS